MFSSLVAAGDWVRKVSYHTAWRCWPLLAGLWRAIAPLMKPWCAEEVVPTAENLNLYRRWKSRVWHRDNEPLFGERGDAKLIVSVSFGAQALFRWKGKSCLEGDATLTMVTFLSWMATVRTSFFTVRIPVWNRSGLTSRSVGPGNILLPVPCGQEQCVVCQRVRRFICCCYEGCGVRRFGCILGAPWLVLALLVYLLVCTGLRVTKVCQSLDTPFGRRLVGTLSA